MEEKLESTKQQLQDVCKELKNVKQKVKRRDAKISSLLQDVKDQNLIIHGQLDLLKLNFGDNTFLLIENELEAQDVDKHGHRYAEDLKQFAVTVHFYSPKLMISYGSTFISCIPEPYTLENCTCPGCLQSKKKKQ